MLLVGHTYCILNEFKIDNDHPRNSYVQPLHLWYLMLSSGNLIKGELIIFSLLSIKRWLFLYLARLSLRLRGRYLKSVPKSISHVIQQVKFQLYRAYLAVVIWKNLTNDDKYISKRDTHFIHQTKCVSKIIFEEGKNISCVVAMAACFIKKCFFINMWRVTSLQAHE